MFSAAAEDPEASLANGGGEGSRTTTTSDSCWVYCDVPNCTWVSKKGSQSFLARHRTSKHPDITFPPAPPPPPPPPPLPPAKKPLFTTLKCCSVPDCPYTSSQAGHIKRHKQNVHSEGVKWNICDHLGCTFKAKEASNLRAHQFRIHGAPVIKLRSAPKDLSKPKRRDSPLPLDASKSQVDAAQVLKEVGVHSASAAATPRKQDTSSSSAANKKRTVPSPANTVVTSSSGGGKKPVLLNAVNL